MPPTRCASIHSLHRVTHTCGTRRSFNRVEQVYRFGKRPDRFPHTSDSQTIQPEQFFTVAVRDE